MLDKYYKTTIDDEFLQNTGIQLELTHCNFQRMIHDELKYLSKSLNQCKRKNSTHLFPQIIKRRQKYYYERETFDKELEPFLSDYDEKIDKYFMEHNDQWNKLNIHKPTSSRSYNNFINYIGGHNTCLCKDILDIIVKYTYPEWYLHGLNVWAKNSKFDNNNIPYLCHKYNGINTVTIISSEIDRYNIDNCESDLDFDYDKQKYEEIITAYVFSGYYFHFKNNIKIKNEHDVRLYITSLYIYVGDRIFGSKTLQLKSNNFEKKYNYEINVIGMYAKNIVIIDERFINNYWIEIIEEGDDEAPPYIKTNIIIYYKFKKMIYDGLALINKNIQSIKEIRKKYNNIFEKYLVPRPNGYMYSFVHY